MKFELKPDNRNASDEDLLNDLKSVANSIKKDSIGRIEYNEFGGRFHSGTIEKRFKGWNNALKKAGLIVSIQKNISEKELLDDLNRVAKELRKESLIRDEYNQYGKYHNATFEKRFGSWLKAIRQAGLKTTLNRNISAEELFENLENIWIELGRQPKRDETIQPLSKFHSGTNEKRFGTWRKALEAFVEYMSKDIDETPVIEEIKDTIQETEIAFKHKTKRTLSSRLKVQVLMRDGNKCKLCGITVTGDNIHFDHIKPWSKGGETELDNLQVLCEQHNLAKGNLEYPKD